MGKIIIPYLNRVFLHWEVNLMNIYRWECHDVPPLSIGNVMIPWNGIQINYHHGSARQSNANDVRGIPTILFYIGEQSGTLRIYTNTNKLEEKVDINTTPRGVLLMDSHPVHEVVQPTLPKNQKLLTPEDGHGFYYHNRISVLLICNRQIHTYISTAHMLKELSKCSRQKGKKL